jgi:hypothetical protein
MGGAMIKGFQFMICGDCGVEFYMPQERYDTALREGGWWWCTNGHKRGFKKGTEQTDLEKERQARQRAEQRVAQERDERLAAERREIAAKSQLTKLKKRIGNGVCPCCQRSFVNLQRHMKTKHPEVVND